MALVPSATLLSTDEMGRVAPPITASVGPSGINRPEDVFIVQSLLNARLPKPHSFLAVTGTLDVGTVLAIQAYQAVILNQNPPSGQVDPGSATFYSLAARPLVEDAAKPPPRYGHVGQVPTDIADAAVSSQTAWRIPAAVTLAQWAVESAWGAAMPRDSNNPFGIKAGLLQAAVESPTHEVVAGERIAIVARFRKFDTVAEAFDQHGKLIATNKVYSRAMALVSDPDAFADALTGVYATDPQYGFTLKWVMKNYGFDKYGK